MRKQPEPASFAIVHAPELNPSLEELVLHRAGEYIVVDGDQVAAKAFRDPLNLFKESPFSGYPHFSVSSYNQRDAVQITVEEALNLGVETLGNVPLEKIYETTLEILTGIGKRVIAPDQRRTLLEMMDRRAYLVSLPEYAVPKAEETKPAPKQSRPFELCDPKEIEAMLRNSKGMGEHYNMIMPNYSMPPPRISISPTNR